MTDPDKSARLAALRIDRDARRAPASRGLLYTVLAVLLLGGAGAGGYYYWLSNAGTPIHAVTVSDSASGGGSGSGLDASGYVEAERLATLSAQIVGKVIYLNAEEGERVKQGDVIARVDDSNYAAALRQAIAQQRQAKQALDDQAPIYERYQRLESQNAISTDAFQNERAAYDAARTALDVAVAAVAVAKSNEDFCTVRAPFTGVVTVKVAQVGDIVSPAAVGTGGTLSGIATLVDMGSLEVEVDVSENYIDRVHAGGAATVTLNAYPDWQIPATVIAVIPTADESKGTVKVRLAMKTNDARILPQMGARVSFETGPDSGPVRHLLSAPAAAVTGNGDTGTVFVISDDKVEARQVKVGLRTSDTVTILSGVSVGDRLASGDLSTLHDGAKVRVVE